MSQKMYRGSTTRKATIPKDEALSNAVPLGGFTHVGIAVPSAWTAASLTFQVSDTEEGTYVDLYTDTGTEVAVAAATSQAIGLVSCAGVFAPFEFMKIRSGTSATSVSQTDERTLTVFMKS